MKKGFLLLICLASSIVLLAQEKMYIHTNGNTLGAPMSEVDSMYFSNDGNTVLFQIGDQVAELEITDIDSISFGDDSETIQIVYNGNSVLMNNPLAFEGVSVSVDGADVIVNSTLEDRKVDYELSGTTTNGMFKLYGEYKYNLILNGVDITNNDGPAINIQCSKKCDLILDDGTANSLTDGSSYASSDEDQKSTLFSEGQIVFAGTGSLTVKSLSKHAICSDDYISIEGGSITVSEAAKDGIHVNDYFEMSGGTLNLTASGDGIDGGEGYVLISGGEITTINASDDVKGITCDSTLTITGGTIAITISGDQSKGLKSGQSMNLDGGTITINTSGNAVLEASGSGYDPSYCTAIKCDEDVNCSGVNITIKTTGMGGKGISSNADILVTGGTIKVTTSGAGAKYTDETGTTDAYTSTCFTADSNIAIINGSIILSSSGLAGKGISADGTFTMGSASTSPTLSVTTSGGEIADSSSGGGGGPGGGTTTSTSYASPKAIKADSDATFTSGTTTISSTDDAIKSESKVTVDGGTITVTTSYEGIEAPYIYINGGTSDITATNDAINSTKGTVSGGTESNDGSYLYITGGTLLASCTNGDAIDSNGNLLVTGGVTIANGPSSGVEEAVDYNGTFNMNGGTFIGCGSSSSMTKSMSSSSTQPNMYVSTNTILASSSFVDVRIGSNDVLTFKPKYGAYKMLLSSPSMTKGASYSIYTGGSYSTNTNIGGYYTGGTYTTGTLKKSGTLSTSSTVNTISF